MSANEQKIEEKKEEQKQTALVGTAPVLGMAPAQPTTMPSATVSPLQATVATTAVAAVASTTRANLYQAILQLAGNDVVEIFGPSGSGKSTFVAEVMKDALAMSPPKKVFYYDDERNALLPPKGIQYVYKPKWDDIYAEIKKLNTENEIGLVVLDSLGAPILGEYATLKSNDQGKALLEAAGVMYTFKYISDQKKCLVIVTNQPESEFRKEAGHELEPFADKSKFFAKEIWRTELASSTPDHTFCNVRAFRSRVFGRGKLLYTMDISGPVGAQKVDVKRVWQ